MQTRPARAARTVVGAFVLVALLAVGAVGCGDDGGSGSGASRTGGSATPKTFEAGDDVDVREGQTFVVEMDATPSTGYSWSAEDNPNVEYVSSRYIHGAKMPGASEVQQMTFRATSSGSSTLVLNYSRPWESDAAAAQTEKFPVTVD